MIITVIVKRLILLSRLKLLYTLNQQSEKQNHNLWCTWGRRLDNNWENILSEMLRLKLHFGKYLFIYISNEFAFRCIFSAMFILCPRIILCTAGSEKNWKMHGHGDLTVKFQ